MSDPVPTPVITVVGSLNIDTQLSVPQLPEFGSTVAATGMSSSYGGKGANQALAACRQGATVSLIGAVGNDAGGLAYQDYLMAQGINVSAVQPYEDTPTGRAYICVNPAGENTIVTVSGANAYLLSEQVAEQRALIEEADVVICQLEVPVEATVYALQTAGELCKTTIFNPSPLNPEFPWGQVAIDFLIVNEKEAASLLGYFVESTAEAPTIRSQMADLGVGTLIITRGSEHTFAFSPNQALKVPPPQVPPVDSTGAGDAFAGTFAVHWAQSQNLLNSLRKANIAGALATQREGAQDAIPGRYEVDNFGKAPAPEPEPEPESAPEEEYTGSEGDAGYSDEYSDTENGPDGGDENWEEGAPPPDEESEDSAKRTA
ncbi:MAG TPA: ribokinase [Verrucomicrobium sp.]|nr:ribokinase [Verrucomicrobium sp.]